MFCINCGEPISLLGMRDKETGYIQYHCFKCNTTWLKNHNGLIFDKKELRKFYPDNLEENEL
jgi:hypothetical protein